MPAPVALVVDNLSRQFGGREAVSGVTLTVPSGSGLAILGLNGSGKTTLLKMVAGLLEPTSGTVRVFGSEGKRADRRSLMPVAAVIDGPTYYPHLTVRRHLSIRATLLGANEAAAIRALRAVSLLDSSDKEARILSAGLKQRLTIALALVGSPKLLLLDEPTRNLDAPSAAALLEILRALRTSIGLTFVVTTHDLAQVSRCATDVAILHQGRLVYSNSMSDVALNRRLTVRCDRPADAAALLSAKGWACDVGGETLTVAVQAAAESAASINEYLVHQGFKVHRLALERRDLEDVFLEFTSGRALR